MPTITVTSTSSDFSNYFLKLSQILCNYLVADPEITLQTDKNSSVTVLPYDTWEEVIHSIEVALNSWTFAIQKKAPFPFPIPIPFYNLLVNIGDRGFTDDRGSFNVVEGDIDTNYSPDVIHEAAMLFQKDGYYAKIFDMFEALDYLQPNGQCKPIKLTYSKADMNEKISTQIKSVDHREFLLPVVAAEHIYIAGNNGYDVHNVGIAQLTPPAKLLQTNFEHRATHILPPGDLGDLDSQARMSAFWIMNGGRDTTQALRSTLTTKDSLGMMFELARTLYAAEKETPYRDMPSRLPQLPNNYYTGIANKLAIILLDPSCIDTSSTLRPAAYRTLYAITRTTNGTSALVESIRAHVGRFLTYGYDYSGSILVSNDKLGIQTSFTEAEFVKKFTTNCLRTDNLLATLANVVRVSPLISVDINRVPISAKYALIVTAINDNNQSSLISEFNSRNEYFDNPVVLLKLASRLVGTMPANFEIADNLSEFFELAGGNIEFRNAFKAYLDAEYAANDEINPDPVGINVSNFTNAMAVGPYYPSIFYLENLQAKETNFVYSKLHSRNLRDAVGIIAKGLHFPTIDTTTSEEHLLNLGYGRINQRNQSVYPEICNASLRDPDTGEPRTPSGAALALLSFRGGFGFASLLSSLAGPAIQAGAQIGGELLGLGVNKLTGLIRGI